MNSMVYLAETEDVPHIARALDSELRRDMLGLLRTGSFNIKQLSEALGIPQSTCTVNIKLLERAKLISTETVATPKGSVKVCRLACHEVVLPFFPDDSKRSPNIRTVEMPIGLYVDFQASAPCGLANASSVIGYFDTADSFLNPHRATAGLIWFTKGHLDYRFPRGYDDLARVRSLSFSAEICSEYPGHHKNWPSDITVWINGVEIGTWTSPGDMGGDRGRLTPAWWPDSDSQYGFLKCWKVTREGSFIDGMPSGGATLAQVLAGGPDSLLVRIGVKDSAEYPGGLNLFGRCFGNYEQDLVLRTEVDQD